MNRIGSASAFAGGSNQTTRRATDSVSGVKGMGFLVGEVGMTDEVKKSKRARTVPDDQRKYYTLAIDFTTAGSKPLRNWLNENEQQKDFRPNADEPFGGFKFTEPPRFRFDRKGRRGAMPDADP